MNTRFKILNAKRLIAEIPDEIHTQVKAQAALKNISIRKYVLLALLDMLKKEKIIE